MYLRALEFSSQENAQSSPKERLRKLNYKSEYSKAKLCGKERILLAKMVPKYINGNAYIIIVSVKYSVSSAQRNL